MQFSFRTRRGHSISGHPSGQTRCLCGSVSSRHKALRVIGVFSVGVKQAVTQRVWVERGTGLAVLLDIQTGSRERALSSSSARPWAQAAFLSITVIIMRFIYNAWTALSWMSPLFRPENLTPLPSALWGSSWRVKSWSQMIAGASSPIFFNEISCLQVVEESLKMWSDGFLKTQNPEQIKVLPKLCFVFFSQFHTVQGLNFWVFFIPGVDKAAWFSYLHPLVSQLLLMTTGTLSRRDATCTTCFSGFPPLLFFGWFLPQKDAKPECQLFNVN